MGRFLGYPSARDDGYNIREVTPETLTTDITSGRLILPPPLYAGLRARLESKDAVFFVAHANGLRRGQIGMNFVGPRNPDIRQAIGAEAVGLTFLDIPEAHRNKQIGSNLVRRAIDHAAQRERGQVFLTVETSNPDARRLYERLGFDAVIESINLPQFTTSPYGTPAGEHTVKPVTVMQHMTPPRQ